MVSTLSLNLVVDATNTTSSLFFSEAVLDVLGVIAAIWTLWVYVWLPLKGLAQNAFRLFALGGITFALLHVLDTVFQVWGVLPKGLPTLVHFGLVLVALIFFVIGLAQLADAVSGWQLRQEEEMPPQHWWPLGALLAAILGAASFIIWGFSLLTVFWADVAVDAGIVVLSLVCAGQVWRAKLGGAVGGALWLALVGLLIFSLAHPVQTWLSVAQLVPGEYGHLLHRLVVIPAFILFSASIARLSRAMTPRVEPQRKQLVDSTVRWPGFLSEG